ncbi:hypothetical protein D9M68_321380 [compost metagenome]
MAATGGTTACATGARAGRGGFEFPGRVDAGLDRLLQLRDVVGGGQGGRLGSLGSCAGDGLRFAPLAVTAEVDRPAIGEFESHHPFKTGLQLFALEESVAFDEQALEPFRRHREYLANNAFDNGNNTAHGVNLLKMALSWLVVAGVEFR